MCRRVCTLRAQTRQLPRHICRMQIGFGISYIIFSCITDWRLSTAIMPFIGFTVVSSSVASNSLVQSIVDETKRARVLSLYVLGNLGFGPIGILIAGHMAEILDAQACALICGVMALIVAFLHMSRMKVYDATVSSLLQEKGL